MGYLLPILLSFTFFCGLILLALALSDRSPDKLALAGSPVLALGSLLLLLPNRAGASMAIAWIPGVDPISVHSAPPATYLVIMVYWSLLLTQWRGDWSSESSGEETGKYWPGLAYLLCAFVAIALTIDQFLARYAILEMVALVTLAIYWQRGRKRGRYWLWRRYLIFRAGDAGLLASILGLYVSTNTFVIERMLVEATSLPPSRQMPIVLGALLAVWVKMGLPPFQAWVLESANLPVRERAWVVAAGLPLLGGYLLYRFDPLLRSLSAYPVLVVLGLASLLVVLVRVYRGEGKHAANAWWLIGHSAFGLLLAPTNIFKVYLLSFLPLRVGLCYVMASAEETWLAQDAVDAIQSRFFKGLQRIRGAMLRLEELWLAAEDRLLFQGTIAKVARQFEQGFIDGIYRLALKLPSALGRSIQRLHTGKLRRNLAWAISIAIILTLMMLLNPL